MTTVINHNENNAQNAGMEWIRIVATLMMFASIGVGAWVMSQQGYAGKAATVLSAGIVFVLTRLWSRGMIGVPTRPKAATPVDPDEDMLRANAQAATRRTARFLNEASVATLCALGLVYGIAFLVLREALTAGLSVFGNIWVCLATALFFGSIVARPKLLKDLFKPFLKDRDAPTPIPAQQAPVATPVQHAAAPAPTSSAPVAAPVEAAPVPDNLTPAVAPKVVRRVVKKVN